MLRESKGSLAVNRPARRRGGPLDTASPKPPTQASREDTCAPERLHGAPGSVSRSHAGCCNKEHPNSRRLAAITPLLLAASPRREMFTSGSSRLSDGPGMHRAVFLCPCSCTKTCPCPRFYKCPGGGGNPAPGDEARNAERLSPSSRPDLQTRHSRRTLGHLFFFFWSSSVKPYDAKMETPGC